MGWIRHHAIVVTGLTEEAIAAAHSKAVELFPPETVTPIISGTTNGYTSFMIGPDGSKEGWGESDRGDKRRDEFVRWMENPPAQSWLMDYVEVAYGSENGTPNVTRPEVSHPA